MKTLRELKELEEKISLKEAYLKNVKFFSFFLKKNYMNYLSWHKNHGRFLQL